MVSELAGEGAVLPQLPTPASHAELRVRQSIRRRSLLSRQYVNPPFDSELEVFVDVGGKLADESDEIICNLSTVLFKSSQPISWSRSMRNWSGELVDFLFVAFISWSKYVESMSAELINRSLMVNVVPSSLVLEQWRSWSRSMKISSRVLVNPLFIAFDCRSWSRSVEIYDNSSEEIEDKTKNLDDGEELTAVNKIRRRRFVFDDEEEQEEQKDEIDVVAAGTSTHIQKLRSAQMKLDLDVVSSGIVLSRASSASLGFSFTGFSKAFSENDQPEDSEKTSFNSAVQQHNSQQPWFSRQNSGGSKSLCSDLEVNHIDIQILMLVWKMQAEKQKVKRPSNFVEFYAYLFRYYLNEQEPKNIVMESISLLLDFVEGSVAEYSENIQFQISVIQFQICPPKTDIEHSIVASDYAQMGRILISGLVVVIVAVTCGGIAFACAGQPIITGYLLVGSIVGPGEFNVVSETVQVETVAQFGVMEKNSTNTLHGQFTIGTLILHDCAVGILFALLPVLGGTLGVLQGVMSITRSGVLMVSLSSQTNELYQLAAVAFCQG
nr:K(+) efflux antiporter 4 isoform X3 [Ipomoea batatas]